MDNKTKLSSMLNCMKVVKNFANDRQDYLNNLEYYSSNIEVEFSDFDDPNTVARVRVFTRSFTDEEINYQSFHLRKDNFADDVSRLDEYIKSLPNLKSAKQAVLMRQLEAVRETSDDLNLDFSAAITEIIESLSSNILEAPKGDVA
jgi:uncharacterized protein YfbU (UPF0304 family)